MANAKNVAKKSENVIKAVGTPADNIPVASKRVVNRRKIAFMTGLVVVSIAFAILTVLAKKFPYFPFDLSITLFIQRIHVLWFSQLMAALTYIGLQKQAVVTVSILAIFLCIKKRYKEAATLLISTLGAEAIGVIIKYIVARPRPTPALVKQTVQYATRDSFPSGHVLFYVGTFGFLLYLCFTLLPKSWYRTVLIIGNSVLLALIGPSRIYEGAHWFSDVVGAYLVGFLWLMAVIFLYHRWTAKNKQP